MAKTLAWVHDLPLVPVNHLEGHIYAAWLLDPDEAEQAGARVPARRARRQRRPHVPGRDDATTCATGCSARRSTTRRARRSTRSAGCSACRIPGGPAIMARGRRARHATTGASRAPGWATRSTSRSAASRPPPGARSRDGARPARRTDGRRRRRPARARRRRAGVGLPGLGRRRARDQDAARGRGRSARGRSSSAAAWPRTRVLRERIEDGAAGLRHPARRAAARAVHRQRGDDRRGRAGYRARGRRRGPATTSTREAVAQARGTGERGPGAGRRARRRAHLGPRGSSATCDATGSRPNRRLSQNHLVDGAGAGGDRRAGRRPARAAGPGDRPGPRAS